MIEQLESVERHCAMCGVLKPLSAYSPCLRRGRNGHHSYCKQCRSKTNNAARARRCKRNNKPQVIEIWPRPLMQSLLDVGCKKWARSVVETNPRFGVAMIGGGYV